MYNYINLNSSILLAEIRKDQALSIECVAQITHLVHFGTFDRKVVHGLQQPSVGWMYYYYTTDSGDDSYFVAIKRNPEILEVNCGIKIE